MAINGNLIIVKIDGTAVAGSRSCEVQTDSELIEISSPNDGLWSHYLVGRKKWSLAVSYLLGTTSDFDKLLLTGTACSISFTDRSGNVLLEGDALIGTVKNTATRGNLAQGSFQFIGNGVLAAPTPAE